MSTRVVGTHWRAVVVIVVRWVVHRVDADGSPADLRGKRVDKCLSDVAQTGVLMGAAGESHRDVGAWIGGSGRTADGRAEQRPRRHEDTNDASNHACSHVRILT